MIVVKLDFSNASLLMDVTLFPIVMEVRLLQPEKAIPPISPLEMVAEVRPKQSKKASFPMEVTLAGMVTEVRLVQNRKALDPIDVTLLGMVTEVRLLHSLKALSPMDVTFRVIPS